MAIYSKKGFEIYIYIYYAMQIVSDNVLIFFVFVNAKKNNFSVKSGVA